MGIGIGYFFVNIIFHMTATITYHSDIANPSLALNCTRKSVVLASPTSSVVHENKAAAVKTDLFSCRLPKNFLGAPLLGIALEN